MNSNNVTHGVYNNLQMSLFNGFRWCCAEDSEGDGHQVDLELKATDQPELAELELKETKHQKVSELELIESDRKGIVEPASRNNNKKPVIEELRSIIKSGPQDIQREFCRQILNHALTDLKPSDSDLTLTLREYILSESLKILKTQGGSKSDSNSYYCFLNAIPLLFSDYNEDDLSAYLAVLCRSAGCDTTEKSLCAFVRYGRSFLDKPLFEIQLIKSPFQNNPQERLLNAMRLCLDWAYSTVHYTNDHLKVVNERAEQIKVDMKKNDRSTKFVKGFDPNAFKEFTKLRNIRSNIQIIDDFIKPSINASAHQLQNSSEVANDFLYLKFKYKKSIFNCLKSILGEIGNTNRMISNALEKSVEFYHAARVSQAEYKKRGIELYIGDELKLEKDFSFENLQKKPELVGENLEAIEAWYLKLCKQYEAISGTKSDTDINEALTWLMFGDEINQAKETIKEVSSKTNSNNTVPTSNTENRKNPNRSAYSKNNKQNISNSRQASTVKEKRQNKQIITNSSQAISLPHTAMPSELNQKQILENHSVFIDVLAKKIKADLHLKCKDAQLKGMELFNAKGHSKELRDHLKYASLNFDLFCKAIQSQDLYAIGAIIPFLFMDQHLVIEQMFKRQMGINKTKPCNSHNLSEIYTSSPCIFNRDQKNFVEDFKDAMLQARYPVSWMHKVQNETIPGPLRWMQYSQNLCDKINMADVKQDNSFNSADLIDLCHFVFDSYEMTLQCILQELNPESEIQESYQKNSKCLEALKGILETSISNSKDNPFTVAVKTKKSRSASNDKNAILKTRQELLQVGQNILNGLNHDKAISGIILEEASNHLGRIDAVDYLQTNYGDLRHAALHHRNLLMFQWIYEQLYRFNGHVALKNELSWSCNHNLELFHALVFPNESSKSLSDFNFVRNVHYNHEHGAGKSLPMVNELLKTRKILKNLDSENWLKSNGKKSVAANLEGYKKTFKNNRLEILKKGKEQLGAILGLTKTVVL